MKIAVLIFCLGYGFSSIAVQKQDCPDFNGTFKFPDTVKTLEQEGCLKIVKKWDSETATFIHDGGNHDYPYADGRRLLRRKSTWLDKKISHVVEDLYVDNVNTERVVTDMSLDADLDIIVSKAFFKIEGGKEVPNGAPIPPFVAPRVDSNPATASAGAAPAEPFGEQVQLVDGGQL